MSMYLLDINFLIALSWPSHVHHAKAHFWFSENAASGWATSPITQLGFVRISSNPKIIPDAVSLPEALSALSLMSNHPYHQFWPDSFSFDAIDSEIRQRIQGHRQVTDAYLLGLAIRRKGMLVTFDQRMSDLLPEKMKVKKVLLILRA